MTPINPRALPMIRRPIAACALALGLAATATAALAQGGFGAFSEQTGEDIYKGVCQGCHMPDGRGAAGAGMYPALAGDKKLAAAAYPALVVIKGQKAMPDFGAGFSDAQIANVVNYIRTHFGNSYTDTLSPADVSRLRPAMAAK